MCTQRTKKSEHACTHTQVPEEVFSEDQRSCTGMSTEESLQILMKPSPWRNSLKLCSAYGQTCACLLEYIV